MPRAFPDVIFPPNGELKLRVPPAKPVYDVDCGEKEYKSTKRMIEARGVEEVHTELIHKQFGLIAITGGFISASDCEWIAVRLTVLLQFSLELQDRVNKNLRARQFAIWRIEDPWLPRTKKP
jgi:large subunit ribosomal protein L16